MGIESGRRRLESYRLGLGEASLEFDDRLVAHGNYRQNEAYEAARRLLSLSPPPTAIIVCNESMTGAVLSCLRDHGVSIPKDMSLVGFDDPDWASFYSPGITTLREERYYMGKLACDALLIKLEEADSMPSASTVVALRTRLVIRQSCAPPRRASRLVLHPPVTQHQDLESGPEPMGDDLEHSVV
jgi:DNA-binding LacI/PurR family transcriptional regulator